MKITLSINGIDTDFYSKGLTAGASLMAYDLAEQLEKRRDNGTLYNVEHREELIRFITELFGGQFTAQQFLIGYRDSFFTLFPDIFFSVITGISSKMQEFPVPNSNAPKATI